MTEEQKEEVNLYSRWKRSNENKILEEYAGEPIEKVPEEYRDKISRLREFGLGIKEKSTYEEVIKFLETHNGKIMKRIGSFFKRLMILAIRFYQKFISPLFPPTCRFYPTCSTYFIQALEKYGVCKGSYLGMKRILKCHPWHEGGYDPLK